MLSNCGVEEDFLEALGSSCKVFKAVNPKGNQSWIFITETDAEPEARIFWLPGANNRLI